MNFAGILGAQKAAVSVLNVIENGAIFRLPAFLNFLPFGDGSENRDFCFRGNCFLQFGDEFRGNSRAQKTAISVLDVIEGGAIFQLS